MELQILSTGGLCTVELVGAPTAALSHRWQVSLNLPARDRQNLIRSPPLEPQAEPLDIGDRIPMRPPAERSRSSQPQESWTADYDYGLLLDEETLRKDPRGPTRGPNNGRRKRSSSEGSQGSCAESRRGGRRLARVREDTDADEVEDLDLSEAAHGDSLLDDSLESLSVTEALGETELAEHFQSPTRTQLPEASLPASPLAASAPAPATPAPAAAPRAGKTTKTRGGAARLYAQKPPSPVPVSPRAAVVVVLGHVDHGKTTLLKALRELESGTSADLSKPPSAPKAKAQRKGREEAGGITQRIGVFEVIIQSFLRSQETRAAFGLHASCTAVQLEHISVPA